MKRIGILTAGGDTPALNATVQGAVTRANQLKIFAPGCLSHPYHSINTDVHKRIRYLDP
jgi:6-phosphofructokinase